MPGMPGMIYDIIYIYNININSYVPTHITPTLLRVLAFFIFKLFSYYSSIVYLGVKYF